VLIRNRERGGAAWVACVVACVAASGPARAAASAKATIDSSGVKGGLVVHLGCGDGRRTSALRLNDRYLVHGLEVSDAKVKEARRNIRASKLYGKVSVCKFDGTHLPYVDNLVNLIVSDGPTRVPRAEIMRVLAPSGVAMIGGRKTVKPRPKNIDEWTHFLRGPDNNAVAADSVVDIPRSIQWVSGPRWGRSHEELASMSAAVSAKGRVFFIYDDAPLATIRFLGRWKLVARDAFSGTLLWKKDVPAWNDHLRHFRSGPVHLPRRLVAVGDEVYVTLGLAAPVTAFDAATGETLRTYRGTEHTEEILVENGVLYLAVGTSEAKRRGGGLHKRGEPEPTGFRYIAAVDAASGRRLWKHACPKGEYLLPLSLTVKGQGVFYQSTFGMVRLDARSGKEVWRTRRPTPARRMGFSAPTVVAADGVLLCADRTATDKDAGGAVVEWGVHGWNESGFPRKGKCTLKAYAIETGKELWSVGASEGYNSPVDVFVTGGTVWVGGGFKGYDLKTGQPKRQIKVNGPPVGMAHPRCHRNKATERFIFTCRSGVEVVSLEKGWLSNNSWIRGTCQYGIMPCNGLLYAPPDACACFPRVKTPGFFAAAPQRGKDGRMPFTSKPPLEKGPAYAAAGKGGAARDAGEWPMYRHDAARSGTVSTNIPTSIRKRWSAAIGGRLTQPVIAGGKVYVSSIDTHTLHAMSVEGGRDVWSYTAGGRIDSAPTVHKGRVLFGSADGWVYCQRATAGELAWRFRAAPREMFAGAYDQIESVWPVHGAVLVQNDTVYVTAGRSSYLDGGIALYGIDPATGSQRSRTVIYHLDPATGKQTGAERRGSFDMEGVRSDVLSGDGDSVFLKHLRFSGEGKQIAEKKPHLFSIASLLLEEWFVRSYWMIGTDTGAGWGRWSRGHNTSPAGRILCFDKEHVYGYGRTKTASAATGHRADAYHLFCRKRSPGAPKPQPADRRRRGRGRGRGGSLPALVWGDGKSLIVRAMVLASDQLAVAGPPDLGRKNPKLLAYTNEKEAVSGFRGEKGVLLRVVSAADGKNRSEQRLTSMPVFDGMSAAGGRLFISLKNGTVECWGK